MAERKSYRFGPFLVDRRSACLRRDGVVVPLRPKTFDVLAYLAQHPGRLVPKTELIDNVWQNLNVTPNSLVQCIKEIRHALHDDTQAIIETVSKRGYLFALPVIAIDGDDAPLSTEAGESRALPLPDRPSIAVLPFDNMSGDPDQDYFADGISEDLITGLSRIRWLFVIARNSTFVYKGRAVDVRQVAQQARRPLCARRQRAPGRPAAAHQRPADRRGDRRTPLGRAIRPRTRRHLCHPG